MTHSLALQRVKVLAIRGGVSGESSSKMLQNANLSRSTWLQVPDAVAIISQKGRKIAD